MKMSFWTVLSLVTMESLSLPLAGARADAPSDPSSIWTLQDENASITTAKLNDKYYVNGLRLSWTSPTGDVPEFISDVSQAIWDEVGTERMAIGVQQGIFTPANTLLNPPDPRDRPYAGTLTLDFSVLQDTDDTRSVLGIQAGLVGPSAEAKEVQNGFHSIIGFGDTRGWKYQIHNEPVLELLAQTSWRMPIGEIGGFETDAVPMLEGGAGNLRVYGLAGSLFRIGQGLNADFGPSRVRPGLTGSDAYISADTAWYLFAGIDGQGVLHDITIDGNSFRDSRSVGRRSIIGEGQIGLAVTVAGIRISYAQFFQSAEISHQRGGLHEYGSLTLAAHF